MTFPTLRTDRLVLAPHQPSDLDECAAMWADARVYAMIGGRPRPREEVWTRLLRAIGQWSAFGYGAWIAREADGGRFVGEVGLLEAMRAIAPPLDRPEMGWALAPAVHGRGYALEAVRAALAWADGRGFAATCCIIDPANARSLRLAERVGYRVEREAAYHDRPTLVLGRAARTRC